MNGGLLGEIWPWLPDLAVATFILYLWLSGKLRTEAEMTRQGADAEKALAVAEQKALAAEERARSAEGKLEQVLREDIRMAREREQTTQMILQAAAAGRNPHHGEER